MPIGRLDPMAQIVFADLFFIHNQSGQVHGIGVACIVKIQCQLVLFFELELFDDGFQVAHFYAVKGLTGTVFHQSVFGTWAVVFLQ